MVLWLVLSKVGFEAQLQNLTSWLTWGQLLSLSDNSLTGLKIRGDAGEALVPDLVLCACLTSISL